MKLYCPECNWNDLSYYPTIKRKQLYEAHKMKIKWQYSNEICNIHTSLKEQLWIKFMQGFQKTNSTKVKLKYLWLFEYYKRNFSTSPPIPTVLGGHR